ncbi:hypothetical protein AALP_AA3G326900 [Arabis alpina]|uniref:C2H2-type domain-containing protein n=1 Tax=Arabis alpina TaxID=50452 RepID=A0A087HD73_ARAAL|nr:hypothetical protein AALP_AA3G326900 [Arabis alpina]
MEHLALFNNDEDEQLHKLAQGHFFAGNHIKALEVIEDSIAIRGKEKLAGNLHFLQDAFSAVALLDLAEEIGSLVYYRKAIKYAKESLSFLDSYGELSLMEQGTKTTLENIVQLAESKMLLGRTEKNSDSKVKEESKGVRDTVKMLLDFTGERLRSYWVGMNLESKRNFVKVDTEELRGYVERLYGRDGLEALEEVLTSAKGNRKWRFWMCRTCSQKFFYLKKFKTHLEQEHAAKFKPCTTKHMSQRVNEAWGGMISVAGWEPVDVAAAAEMIKTRIEFVKEFVYEKGWCKDWPLAADEERSKLLKEIQLLLVSFWDRKILSCGVRDWMMRFPVKHLAKFEVSEHTLTTECRLSETPQSICFLECHELNKILDLLKQIKCERDDGTDVICRAVDSLWGLTRVKEKIELDRQFTFMLLDKRLLRGKIASFDDEGAIDVCDHNVYYAKTHPQGDDIVTWFLDYPLIDESFEFPRSIRAHNLDIWVAILRSIHFTCRTLGSKYSKKLQILSYAAGLHDAKNICLREDERRRSVLEYQGNSYVSLLGDKCEEHYKTDAEDFLSTELFLCAVKDVLEEASHPTFDFPDLDDDCLNFIHGKENLSDDRVLKSIDVLRSVVFDKVPLADSKILLVENSRINLLNELARLSAFDYRSYILSLLKRFLREKLDGLVDMDAKAKAATAEADLLSEEGKKSVLKKKKNKCNKDEFDGLQELARVAAAESDHLDEKKQQKENTAGSKKKKHENIKRTSTSMSSLRDQNVEHESSVNVELGVTSPSLKPVEEVSVEPEDTLSSEISRLEISSHTNNQEEAPKDMETMPGEASLSKDLEGAQGEAATRHNSALEMTLKALCNIKVLKEYLVRNQHQFQDNLEEQVPCALQNFFTAFVSKEIKDEKLYRNLLSKLLASLEEVHSMSRNAAELLSSILEFWPCWKSSLIESVVTHLFTLEEYERMTCSKCSRKPNYPEQSSYGIVTAADSIRDLKCAFGNAKFDDILKMIRMEDKMLCDIKTGGCGEANVVHHIISTCPPIFTIVLKWEKGETDKEISETTNALEWEIDMSKLYEGLEPNTKYRLVSMVGCGEAEEYICLVYKKTRWFNVRLEALAKESIGNWKNVVKFCGERKVRPEILFYEAVQWPHK